MATFDYDEAREAAKELIELFGEAGQVIKKGITGGKDKWGNVTSDTPDVVIDGTITPKLDYSAREIDGKNIQAGDALTYFHSTTRPAIGMQTTINSETYKVVAINALTSLADVNIYTELQIRK